MQLCAVLSARTRCFVYSLIRTEVRKDFSFLPLCSASWNKHTRSSKVNFTANLKGIKGSTGRIIYSGNSSGMDAGSLSTLVHKFSHVFFGYAANGRDSGEPVFIFLSNLARSCLVNFHSNGAAIIS